MAFFPSRLPPCPASFPSLKINRGDFRISECPIPRWVWKSILNPQVSKSHIPDWRKHPGKLHLQLSGSSYPAISILLNQEVAAIFPTKTFYVFYMNIIFNCNNEPFYFAQFFITALMYLKFLLLNFWSSPKSLGFLWLHRV